MRICYLCPDLGIPLGGRKGASAHVRGLIRALCEAGHAVRVVSGAPEKGSCLRVPVTRVTPSRLGDDLAGFADKRLIRALRHVLSNAGVERVLFEAIADWRPDLIYERYSPFGVAGGIIARAVDVPHVLEVNASLAQEGKKYRKQALPELAFALERAAFAATRRIVAVSEELRDELVAAGVERSRIAVVPNGVDAELFSVEGATYSDGLDGRFVIGFVGSLRPWHAVDTLVDAFRRLAADPRYHLLVVGDGPMACVLELLERERPDRITFVRAVDHEDVPKYVRRMDVAVAPYPSLEGFYFSPLKVLEYLAAGRPVVASAIGQLKQLVREGETGLLVPPGDAAALAEAIQHLADDEGFRARLGARAAEVARREHTWSRRASQILKLVDVVDGTGQSGR